MNLNEVSRGIPHLEDLSVSDFINVVSCLENYEITEKVDGSQILFGLDEHGFYTSRETKGGTRVYAAEDYDLKFSTTYMRSAHKLLEAVLPELKGAGLKPGDQVEAEVLYGELPNVVPYSADRNYLIFLRTTEGTVNIDRLKQKLIGHSLSITLEAPFTPDGRTIELREESNLWMFSRTPIIKVKLPSLAVQLKEMKKFLNTKDAITGKTYESIIATPLNKIPEWVAAGTWKDIKEHLKEKKEYINGMLHEGHMMPIKEILLNQLVRNTASPFGPLLEDGGWVEGVVLRDHDGAMVKLVDKDKFGTIRENAWRVRNQLTESARSIDGDHSFLGGLRVLMARALGHAELGTTQAKRYLSRGIPLTEGINAKSVKEYWLGILDLKESELIGILDKYEKEEMVSAKTGLAHERPIKQRTREAFAETFQKINDFKVSTVQAKTPTDLLEILIGKHLT